MAELKRNMIELVKEVKEGEIVTEKHTTPMFIKMDVVYEAIDLYDELTKFKGGAKSEKELIDKMLTFVADKVYGKQFTREELFSGLHAPTAVETLQNQILFVARGQQDETSKKYFQEKKP